ncbi:unnamed protein product [Citrullus colocynthis]|uniref:Cytochrome b5 heme-binding domain-containing protein n=1 Tax=Citrullus colocynthis TaxID=252529 RepID=A0ABP0XX89_9ROSI
MELTPQQLLAYNGTDRSKPIYVALKGRIYDVTTGAFLYGPGGPYAIFAGKDASRALAKMTKNEADITSSLTGLSEKEIAALNNWEKKFQAKYPIVGRGLFVDSCFIISVLIAKICSAKSQIYSQLCSCSHFYSASPVLVLARTLTLTREK